MKRAFAVLVVVTLICSGLAACSAPAASFNHVKAAGLKFTDSDSLASETQGLPDKFNDLKKQVAGFSPDGRKAVLWDAEKKTVSVVSAMGDDASGSVTPDPDFTAQKKHPVWAKDAKSFLFADSYLFGQELVMSKMTNGYVFSVTGGLSFDRATDIDTSKKTLSKGGALIYSAMYSADEKSVVYAKRTTGKWEICKSKISSQDETVLMERDSEDTGGFYINDVLELKTGLLLGTLTANGKNPDTLFLYDAAKDKQTDLDNDALDLPDNFRYFDIRDWSVDRRTVLVLAWSMGMNPDTSQAGVQAKALYVLRFNDSFTGMTMQKISMEDISGDSRFCMDAVLSPDGKYIASYEITGGSDKKHEAALYSLDKKQRSVLRDGDAKLMYPVTPLNGYQQTFFFTSDKRLIVSYTDSWKVYALK